MTNETIPLARAWAVKFLGQHGKADEEMLDVLRALVNPPKPSPRLRLVNLDADESMIIGDDRLYVDAGDAPDPMAVIEQAVRDWHSPGEQYLAVALIDNIRVALEGAAT